jgi:hypothetical protein
MNFHEIAPSIIFQNLNVFPDKGVWYKIRVIQMTVMGILASMEHRPPKFRFRVVMMTFLVLLTFTTGATIAVLNFLMESKQSREEGNKVLRLVSEDINDLTRFLLQTVSNRTRSMGRLADSGLLDFKTESLIIQGGKQVLQSDAHIISIEIIEHSSGNLFQVTNDVNDKLIITKTTRDPITNKIQLLKYDPKLDGNKAPFTQVIFKFQAKLQLCVPNHPGRVFLRHHKHRDIRGGNLQVPPGQKRQDWLWGHCICRGTKIGWHSGRHWYPGRRSGSIKPEAP